MKLVLEQQGITVECSCDEFKEIYPALYNGKALQTVASPEANVRAKEKSEFREGSNTHQVYRVFQKNPNKELSSLDIVSKGVPITVRAVSAILSKLCKDKYIKRGTERGSYVFLSLEEGEAKANSIQNIQRVSIEPGELTQEMVQQIWVHVKPLFLNSSQVHDSQLFKVCSNLAKKDVYRFIVQAIKAELIQETTSGFYRMVQKEALEEEPINKMGLAELNVRGSEYFKRQILEAMQKESPFKKWRTMMLAETCNLSLPAITLLLKELKGEGKIKHGYHQNGKHKQRVYYSLKDGEPEPLSIEGSI